MFNFYISLPTTKVFKSTILLKVHYCIIHLNEMHWSVPIYTSLVYHEAISVSELCIINWIFTRISIILHVQCTNNSVVILYIFYLMLSISYFHKCWDCFMVWKKLLTSTAGITHNEIKTILLLKILINCHKIKRKPKTWAIVYKLKSSRSSSGFHVKSNSFLNQTYIPIIF